MATIKTESVVIAYSLLKNSSLKGVEKSAKFSVLKICKELKAVSVAFEDFRSDVVERLKDEQMHEKVATWSREGESCKFSDEEKIAINAYLTTFNNQVNECLKEEADKPVELEYDRLSEEQFVSLIDANENWDVEQIMLLSEILTN